jgi:ribosomal protein S18 acetylase RimI-like enzyme
MRVRPARSEELTAIGELTVEAYLLLPDPPGEDYMGVLRDAETRFREAEVLVAVDDADELLGSVTYVGDVNSSLAEFDEPDEACFRMLAVRPQARGQGVGGALVQVCIDRARGQAKTALTLYTTDGMAPARRIYERFGFHRADERDIIFESGFALRSYVLEL